MVTQLSKTITKCIWKKNCCWNL